MRDTKTLITTGLLIAASSYCFIGGLVDFSKKYAAVGVGLFLGAGALCFTNEILDGNSNVRKIQRHVCLITEIAGIDLLLMDVAIISGVEHTWALVLALPSAVDLVVHYLVDNSWNYITDLTHAISLLIYFYFGIRDARYILVGAGVAHLFAIYGGRRNDWSVTSLSFAIGVFCTGWFLGGKDFNDLESIVS